MKGLALGPSGMDMWSMGWYGYAHYNSFWKFVESEFVKVITTKIFMLLQGLIPLFLINKQMNSIIHD